VLDDAATGAVAGRSSRRRWITSLLVAGLLLAIVIYVARQEDELALVRGLSPAVLIATMVLQLLSQLALNASMLLPLRMCASSLGFWELMLVRTGGHLVGSLVPVAGGLAVRLAYLRKRGLSYLDFVWATLLSNVLALVTAAALSVAGIAILWMAGRRPEAAVLAVTGSVVTIAVAALIGFELLPRLTRHRWLRRWEWLSAVRGWRETPGLSTRVLVYSMLRHVLNFVTFGLLAQSLSRVPLDFLTGGLVYALTSPVRMVNVTPANLGVNEWVVALVGRVLSFDLTTGLIVAVAFRVIGIVAQAVAVAIGSASLAAARRA
jgi:uncharacterized membrane protein YbhN (UPF0104 family)